MEHRLAEEICETPAGTASQVRPRNERCKFVRRLMVRPQKGSEFRRNQHHSLTKLVLKGILLSGPSL